MPYWHGADADQLQSEKAYDYVDRLSEWKYQHVAELKRAGHFEGRRTDPYVLRRRSHAQRRRRHDA
jgi:hypothetical protein